MFNVVLMTALSAGAEAPDCGRRHQHCPPPPPPCCVVVCCDAAPVVDATIGTTGTTGTTGSTEQPNKPDSDFTADELKQLEAAGATKEDIDGFRKDGYGHEHFKECLDAIKKAKKPDSDFTADELKQLEKAGATKEDIADFRKQGYGHERFKETLEAVKEAKKKEKESDKEVRISPWRLIPAPASIIVRLPGNAVLKIDDQLTASKGARRVFVSPAIPTDREYHYTLTAEIVKDGVTQSVTEKVKVVAGRTSVVAINFPQADVAQK